MWSKTKKHLENFICGSLKGRVEFFCSNYRMHDGIGRTYIAVDKKEVYNMCTLKSGYYSKPEKGLYSQVEFMEAVNEYFNAPIDDLLKSDNTLIKILILLDRRVGKKTLRNMQSEIVNEEEIVQYFYKLRCSAELIKNNFNPS
jgi:hypothetical protein